MYICIRCVICKMIVKIKEFIADRIPCQIEKKEKDFLFFGSAKTRIVDSVRDESLVEVMNRLNKYIEVGVRVINVESIFSINYKATGDSSGNVNLNNLINVIGYRLFYEEM